MSVLHTMRKRTDYVTGAVRRAKDRLAGDAPADFYKLLIRCDSS